jgi:alkylhydroperoxidase family enzyme
VGAVKDEALVRAVIDDFHTAPISDRVRAMLVYLEKVTRQPEDVGPADAAALRAAGVDERAAEEALYVCFLFNVMDRFADSFDFEISGPRQLKWVQRILHNVGYGVASDPG